MKVVRNILRAQYFSCMDENLCTFRNHSCSARSQLQRERGASSAQNLTGGQMLSSPLARRASATATPMAVAAGYQGASFDGGTGGGRLFLAACPAAQHGPNTKEAEGR